MLTYSVFIAHTGELSHLHGMTKTQTKPIHQRITKERYKNFNPESYIDLKPLFSTYPCSYPEAKPSPEAHMKSVYFLYLDGFYIFH